MEKSVLSQDFRTFRIQRESIFKAGQVSKKINSHGY